MRWCRSLALGGALCLVGTQSLSCDQTPPIDQNFDSSLGDDFKAPPPTPDAGPDAGPDAADASAP
jgi:hypothetical protein